MRPLSARFAKPKCGSSVSTAASQVLSQREPWFVIRFGKPSPDVSWQQRLDENCGMGLWFFTGLEKRDDERCRKWWQVMCMRWDAMGSDAVDGIWWHEMRWDETRYNETWCDTMTWDKLKDDEKWLYEITWAKKIWDEMRWEMMRHDGNRYDVRGNETRPHEK